MRRSAFCSRIGHFIPTRLSRKPLIASVITLCFIIVFLLSPQNLALHLRETLWRESDSPEVWASRASAVKDAFEHAYSAYEQIAFPNDELRPLTKDATVMLNGWGLTAIDSLDTLILMERWEEVNRTINHVATLNFQNSPRILVFETIIRYLGGLLSAYHLTENPILLQKADELATTLLPAFNTSSGLPAFAVNAVTGGLQKTPWNGGRGLLAEIGSFQMEFKYLAHLTGKVIYFEIADNVTGILERSQGTNGLWNSFWSIEYGNQTNKHLSVGAWADSAYEYLLKEYILTGQQDKRLLNMYRRAAYGAISQLTYISPKRHLLYITSLDISLVSGVFEHLSCFFPGLLALGTWILPDSAFSMDEERYLHNIAAEGIAETCWITYKDMITGIGAEEVFFEPFLPRDPNSGNFMLHYAKWVEQGRKGKRPPIVAFRPPPKAVSLRGPRYRDYSMKNPEYKLRPETIESIFLMWKFTGDPIWRRRAWEIFQNIEKWTRLEHGYAALRRVDQMSSGHSNSMPSYFLAETLKYLYLTFLDHDPWPLDKYVFNTEAHPFPVFRWTEAEQQRWDKLRATRS